MKVNGKDYPIYYGKEQMFETTNQFSNCMGKYVTHIYIYMSIIGIILTLLDFRSCDILYSQV